MKDSYYASSLQQDHKKRTTAGTCLPWFKWSVLGIKQDIYFSFFEITTPRIINIVFSEFNASEMITIVFRKGPSSLVSYDTFIIPVLPGKTGFDGIVTSVHPHDAVARIICKGILPVFVNLKKHSPLPS